MVFFYYGLSSWRYQAALDAELAARTRPSEAYAVYYGVDVAAEVCRFRGVETRHTDEVLQDMGVGANNAGVVKPRFEATWEDTDMVPQEATARLAHRCVH